MSVKKTTAKSSTSEATTNVDPVTETANDQHLAPQPAPTSNCACHNELVELYRKTDTLQSAQIDTTEQLRAIIHQQQLTIHVLQQRLHKVSHSKANTASSQ
jgi:hypothetical protein